MLFSDIEGSTERWETDAETMQALLQHHDQLIVRVVERHGGNILHVTGDGVVAAFADVGDATLAALDLQDGLARGPQETGIALDPLRIRIGLHRGVVESRDGDLFGPVMNRGARIMDAGHGGQIMVSRVVAEELRTASPVAVQLVDRGVHRLKGLHEPESITELLRPGAAASDRALRTENASEGWLPAIDDDIFVGREAELSALESKLEPGRLVTLVGTGGVGKTRLAVHAAYRMRSAFPGGVWFVDLAAISEPSRVLSALADVLAIAEETTDELVVTVRRALNERQALLVVDNCEHVLAGVLSTLRAVRSDTSRAALLCTSQRDLGLKGEQVLHLAPLSFEGDARTTPAGQLFVQRALLANADFVADDDAMQHIAAICTQVEGLPLAVELAAARVRVLTVATIAERLADTFELLRTRDTTDRHQALDATISWSVALLDDTDRKTLLDLSVFNSTFDWRAAAAVSGRDEVDVVDSLDELVRRSMLVRSAEGFRLLAPMRRYCSQALEQADGAASARAHHAQWMRRSVPDPLDDIDATIVASRLNALLETIDDLHAAHVWFLAHDPPEAARLALDLVDLWNVRSRGQEAITWLSACDTDQVPIAQRVEVLGWIAAFDWTIGHNEDGEQAARRAIALAAAAGLPLPTTAATRLAVRLAFSEHATEALALANDVEHEVNHGNGDATRVFGALAVVVALGGDYEHALRLVDRAVTEARSVGVMRLLSAIANRLLVSPADDYSVATSAEAADLARAIGRGQVLAHIVLATAHRRMKEGDVHGYLRGAAEFCDLIIENEPTNALAALQLLPEAAATANPRGAAVLLAALERLAAQHDQRGTEADRARHTAVADTLQRVLGPDEFARACREGQTLTLNEAVDLLHWICDSELPAVSS